MRPLVEVRLADLDRQLAARPRIASIRSAWRRTSWSADASRAASFGRGRAAASPERAGELVHVERVDEDARLRRDELGRPADAGGDDRAAAGHRLEQRLSERLEQARLREDVALGQEARHLVVRDAAEQPRRPRDPRARRAADRRRRRSASPRRAGRTPPRAGRRSCARRASRRRGSAAARPAAASTAKRSRSTPLETTSVFPRASGTFVSSSRRRYSETQTTAAARRTTKRVAAATPGIAPTLRTSRPWAVTTSGARPASAAISPEGTRKCA